MDVETFPALDMTAQGMTVRKSTIFHPDAALGQFVSKAFGKGEVVV